MLGEGGSGTWKPEYWTPEYRSQQEMRPLPDYMTANQKSILTSATPIKPWAQPEHSQMQANQSYYNINPNRRKKYF